MKVQKIVNTVEKHERQKVTFECMLVTLGWCEVARTLGISNTEPTHMTGTTQDVIGRITSG